jgi:hypothetical protein
MSGLRGNVSNSKEERMRKIAAWVLVLGMAMSPAVMAADGNDKTSDAKTDKSSTSTTTTKANTPAPTSTELEAEIEQLRALLKEQADQLAAMKAAMANGSTATANSSNGTVANSAPSSNSTAATSGVTTASATPAAAAPASATPTSSRMARPAGPTPDPAQAMNSSDHSPLSFKIGDALFTPGGFMDFTTVFRTESTGNGIGTTFNGVPFINTNSATAGPAGFGETRFSVQNSRIALRVDAPVGEAKITGYVEADFLGAIAANANVTSNSDTFRMRLYFGDYRRGKWEVLAGQDWSMLTPNRKGIGAFPGDIFYSQDMDTNYQVGLTWKRAPQFRVLYHPNDSWTMGVSVENPDASITSATTTPTLFAPVSGQLDATSGGTLSTPPTPGYIPDFIFKVANDTKVGEKNMHVEAVGLFREFKLYTPNSITGIGNVSRTDAGFGGSLNANLELFKDFHLIANTFWSDGGGVYIGGNGPDLVVRQLTTTSPFTPSPVRAYSGIGGFEWQARKSIMLYGYYSGAYYGRDFSVNPSAPTGPMVGYGFTGSANSNNRAIQEGTIGWIQTFFQNPNYGKLQLITQGSYLTRAPWFVPTATPHDAHLFMVYADLRYTLP